MADTYNCSAPSEGISLHKEGVASGIGYMVLIVGLFAISNLFIFFRLMRGDPSDKRKHLQIVADEYSGWGPTIPGISFCGRSSFFLAYI